MTERHSEPCGCVYVAVDVPDDQWIGQGWTRVVACPDHPPDFARRKADEAWGRAEVTVDVAAEVADSHGGAPEPPGVGSSPSGGSGPGDPQGGDDL
jgi:hypothetical protein